MTLTSEHLATIRARYSEGVSQAALAREYDVAPQTIKRIVCEPDYQPQKRERWPQQRREQHAQIKRKHRNAGVNTKLTYERVRTIKALLALGERGDVIAGYYGVSSSAISLIKSGKRWKDVEVVEVKEGERSG